MTVRTLIRNTATATAFAAMTIFASACSHNRATGDYGHVDTTAAANNTSSSSQADTAINNNINIVLEIFVNEFRIGIFFYHFTW